MTAPRVSVIMPVFNGARFIRESIESVLAQDDADFELLIEDDASSDDSFDIARSYDDPRIRVFRSRKNRGDARARNAILRRARGLYIAPHDADDVMLPGRIGAHARFLDAHHEYGFVYGWVRLADEHLVPTYDLYPWLKPIRNVQAPPRPIERATESGELRPMPLDVAHWSATFRRTLIEELGGYRYLFSPIPDVDLVVRAGDRTRSYFLCQPTTLYRRFPGTLSEKKALRAERRVPRPTERRELAVGPFVVHLVANHRRVFTKIAAMHVDELAAVTRDPDLEIELTDWPTKGATWGELGLSIDDVIGVLYFGHRTRAESDRCSEVYLHKERLSRAEHWESGLVAPLLPWFATRGRHLCKAGGVARGDRAVLLVGGTREQTTDLTMSFLVAGYRYFASELVLLSDEGATVVAERFPKRVRLDQAQRDRLGKLRRFATRSGEHFVFDPKRAFGAESIAERSPVQTILNLQFSPTADFTVARSSAIESVAHLTREWLQLASWRTEAQKEREAREVAFCMKVAGCARVFVVKYGPDHVADFAERLAPFLQ